MPASDLVSSNLAALRAAFLFSQAPNDQHHDHADRRHPKHRALDVIAGQPLVSVMPFALS